MENDQNTPDSTISIFLNFLELIQGIFPSSSEFWSAIIGAIVGGLIAYFVQLKALRENRRQRDEDHARVQLGLGNSLLFKMIRIHSNFVNIHRHMEKFFERSKEIDAPGEPWQIVLPFGNLPDDVHFSPEEMGFLLGLKNDGVFNSVIDMDIIHNGFIESVRTMNNTRKELSERLRVVETDGDVAHIGLAKEEYLLVRPKMVEVNTLVEQIRKFGGIDCKRSKESLTQLHTLLRSKLGLTYRLETK